MDSQDKPANREQDVNWAAVDGLLTQLHAELASNPSTAPEMERLRSEVAELRAALGNRTARVEDVHAVHGLLDRTVAGLEAEAFTAAGYAAQIGRIIGLT